MFGFKRNKAFVGLDIGSHAIKAMELRIRQKGNQDVFQVAKIGYEPLPRDVIVEGTIIDSTAVSETIRTLFEKNKIGNRDVVISISGNSVIIKKIFLPAMEREELAESIVWEAKHNIPYPYEETHIDYAVLRPSSATENQNLEILLVAVKKDKVAAYRNVIQQARKNLEAVEVDALAIHNAFEINYPDEFRDNTTALVNMGASLTTIVICHKGLPQLFRDLPIGGFYFAENIRKDLNVSLEDAEDMLQGILPQATPPYEFEAVLNLNIKSLLDEIEKTFAFFEAEDKQQKKIEQILLSGGLAGLKNLPRAFEQRFEVKTALFDPFRTVIYNEKKLNGLYYGEMAAFFGVALGLAARKKEK